MGSAAFLAPLIRTLPWRGRPPSMRILSMRSPQISGERAASSRSDHSVGQPVLVIHLCTSRLFRLSCLSYQHPVNRTVIFEDMPASVAVGTGDEGAHRL